MIDWDKPIETTWHASKTNQPAKVVESSAEYGNRLVTWLTDTNINCYAIVNNHGGLCYTLGYWDSSWEGKQFIRNVPEAKKEYVVLPYYTIFVTKAEAEAAKRLDPRLHILKKSENE